MARRLLVISHGFPPYYGGAEHAAGYLARAAVQSGRWTVDVLTSDIGGRLPARETWEGMSVIRVPARKRAWARHTVPELMSFVRAASACNAFTKPDMILAHFTLPAGEVARRVSKRSGAPYAVVLQGSDVPGYQNRRFGVLYALVRPWVRRVWRGAHSVIAVSDALRDLALRSWPGGRIAVVPNGVDLDRFQPLDASQRNASNPRIVLVTVAQLIERKGLQYLIEAMAQLPPDRKEAMCLRICGTGPFEPELRRLARRLDAEDRVEFLGLVKHEELPGILRAADAFVLPSLQEGLPLALMEAMACGLPAIATRVGGIPDVVREGVSGFTVPAGDVGALRHALVRLVEDPARRARMGGEARRDAQSLSWNAVWERYEALLLASRPDDGVKPCG